MDDVDATTLAEAVVVLMRRGRKLIEGSPEHEANGALMWSLTAILIDEGRLHLLDPMVAEHRVDAVVH